MNGTEIFATCVTLALVVLKLLGCFAGSWWWIIGPPLVYFSVVITCSAIEAYKELKQEKRHGKSN